jgi:prolipoprotein diacylglyceryltransferase
MLQVLVRIPLPFWPYELPLFGFGLMLFLAFVTTGWLAARRAQREGINPDIIWDLALFLFFGGLLGARITFIVQHTPPQSLMDFLYKLPRIWDGGIILYGAVLGGVASYLLFWRLYLCDLLPAAQLPSWMQFLLKVPWYSPYWLLGGEIAFVVVSLFYRQPSRVSTLKLCDIIAPSIALGLALGRVGCFLNGCCYGQVACPDCAVYPVHFPLSAAARVDLVRNGYQTAAGFLVEKEIPGEGVVVGLVEPGSAAAHAGLKRGDMILQVEVLGKAIPATRGALDNLLGLDWPKGESVLSLLVRPVEGPEHTLAFVPRTLGLHPTQLYETISMGLLFLLLLAYYPLRTRDGQVIAVLMMCYAIHRYINEHLRNDPRPVGFESYGSLILLGAGVALYVYLWLRPAQYRLEWNAAPSAPAPSPGKPRGQAEKVQSSRS